MQGVLKCFFNDAFLKQKTTVHHTFVFLKRIDFCTCGVTFGGKVLKILPSCFNVYICSIKAKNEQRFHRQLFDKHLIVRVNIRNPRELWNLLINFCYALSLNISKIVESLVLSSKCAMMKTLKTFYASYLLIFQNANE